LYDCRQNHRQYQDQIETLDLKDVASHLFSFGGRKSLCLFVDGPYKSSECRQNLKEVNVESDLQNNSTDVGDDDTALAQVFNIGTD